MTGISSMPASRSVTSCLSFFRTWRGDTLLRIPCRGRRRTPPLCSSPAETPRFGFSPAHASRGCPSPGPRLQTGVGVDGGAGESDQSGKVFEYPCHELVRQRAQLEAIGRFVEGVRPRVLPPEAQMVV